MINNIKKTREKLEKEYLEEDIPFEEENLEEDIPLEEENLEEDIPLEEENLEEDIPFEEESLEEDIPFEEENTEKNINSNEDKKIRFRIFKPIKNAFNYIKNKFIKIGNYVDGETILDLENSEDLKKCKEKEKIEISEEENKSENIDEKVNNEDLKKSKNDENSEETVKKTNEKINKKDETNNHQLETLGAMVEKYQMIGYEVELRKNKTIMYYKEHEEEIKKGSKKQLEKYASKLSKLKELETEYSILGTKIEARRKFEAKKMDQLFNCEYEKRDNIMGSHLTNVKDLEQELEYKKLKAATYFKEHEEEIKKGSKKQLEKYASKLSKVKEVQNEYDIVNSKYKSLRKEKEASYNMLFR